jgi:hypothetical protein
MVSKRDEFPAAVSRAVSRRAGLHCSNPECGRATTGPQAFNELGVINIGVGALTLPQQPLAASVMINRSPQKSEAPRIIVFGFARTAQKQLIRTRPRFLSKNFGLGRSSENGVSGSQFAPFPTVELPSWSGD